MSLAIDVDKVKSVLLSDGQWYVVSKNSFTLDAYEFIWFSKFQDKKKDIPCVMHAGGNSNISATGFSFLSKVEGGIISGPLSSIVAVKY